MDRCGDGGFVRERSNVAIIGMLRSSRTFDVPGAMGSELE